MTILAQIPRPPKDPPKPMRNPTDEPAAYLAPDITTAILIGIQPVDLTADWLTKPGTIP